MSLPHSEPDLSLEHVPVAIVGAGPTGIAAATLLARYGVETVILERWEGVYPQPRAVHVDGEVRRILAALGVEQEFAKITMPMGLARFVDRDMKVLFDIHRQPTGRNGYPDANMLDQPEFESVLRNNAGRFPEITMRNNVEVESVTQADGAARVRYFDHATGVRTSISADYVLGCDGANSVVRKSLGTSMRNLKFEQRWLVVDVATDGPLPGHGIGVCDPIRAGIYVRNGKTRYRWEFRLGESESAADFQEMKQLEPLIAPWTKGIDPGQLELIRVAEYTFRAQHADKWREGRIFILGDAAHLTPPFIGQGMCAGLRDAGNLAWKLAGVLAGDIPAEVLDTYEVERKPHVKSMIQQAKLLGRALTEGGELGNLLRRLIMPRLHLVPGVEKMITTGETPRLGRSTLVRRRPLSVGLAGRLVPNVLVDDDGRKVDDLIDGRFAVIAQTDLPLQQRQRVESCGAVLIVARPGGGLKEWLRRGRAVAALVRPDAVVALTGTVDDVIASLPRLQGFQSRMTDQGGRRDAR